MMIGPTGKGEMMIEVRGTTMTQFAQRLAGRVDRSVIDKTGVAGMFNFHLEFTPDPYMRGQTMGPGRGGDAAAAGPSDAPPSDTGPNLFAALQEQIGLRLLPEKGPVKFLIIESVQKPAAN